MAAQFPDLLDLKSGGTNNPIQKIEKGLEETFLQRTYTDCRQAHENVFHVTSH